MLKDLSSKEKISWYVFCVIWIIGLILSISMILDNNSESYLGIWYIFSSMFVIHIIKPPHRKELKK